MWQAFIRICCVDHGEPLWSTWRYYLVQLHWCERIWARMCVATAQFLRQVSPQWKHLAMNISFILQGGCFDTSYFIVAQFRWYGKCIQTFIRVAHVSSVASLTNPSVRMQCTFPNICIGYNPACQYDRCAWQPSELKGLADLIERALHACRKGEGILLYPPSTFF